MPLTLCSNCRLPVQHGAAGCPLCGAAREPSPSQLSAPITAVLAFLATLALLTRKPV